MVMLYTPYDEALVRPDAIRMEIYVGDNAAGVIAGLPAAAAVSRRENIRFQFPPKITEDSREGQWDERPQRGPEPIAVYTTSGPRKISIQWSYLITGGRWDISTVRRELRKIRGYFALVRDMAHGRDPLVVFLRLWGIGGDGPTTARIQTASIKYSDTVIGLPPNPLPLRSDVSVQVRLWHRTTSRNQTGVVGEDEKEVEQDVPGLIGTKPDWY